MTTDMPRTMVARPLLVVGGVVIAGALLAAGYAWGANEAASAPQAAAPSQGLDYTPTTQGTPQAAGVEQGSPEHHLEIVCLGLGMAVLDGESSTSSWDNGFSITRETVPAAREYLETYCPASTLP
nr:hypothetical protein [Sphaerisporangium cinnabarinum]